MRHEHRGKGGQFQRQPIAERRPYRKGVTAALAVIVVILVLCAWYFSASTPQP